MVEIKKGDFVVAKVDINSIEKRSVGLVEEANKKEIKIFFVGKKKTITSNKNELEYLDLTKTGKPYEKKICNVCHLLKDRLGEFAINQTDAQGRKTTRPSCNMCRINIDGDKFLPSEKKRMDSIKPKNIFICPLCNKTSIVGVTANLVRDHDHHTGKGRAWICDSCNTGLGRFKDDPKKQDLLFLYPL